MCGYVLALTLQSAFFNLLFSHESFLLSSPERRDHIFLLLSSSLIFLRASSSSSGRLRSLLSRRGSIATKDSAVCAVLGAPSIALRSR